MSEINDLGHQEEATASGRVVKSPKLQRSNSGKRVKSPKAAAGEMSAIQAIKRGEDGTLTSKWNDYFPRPPSMKNLNEDGDLYENAEQVAVFNANTHEGSTMVKVLSEKGLRVVAAVRISTSKNTQNLMKLKGVTVKQADWSDEASLRKVASGCSRAFVVTKYWEKFDSKLEEQMASNILRACAHAQPPISHLVLATFEDAKELIARKRVSQLVPTVDGKIYPRFEGKKPIDKQAKDWGVQITHMMTSYMDDGKDNRKSLILIRGDTGRIIVQPHLVDKSKH